MDLTLKGSKSDEKTTNEILSLATHFTIRLQMSQAIDFVTN